MKKYSHVALGGTFDHLHVGHKAIIDRAFEVGKHVSIGIAADSFVRRKFLAGAIESYAQRAKNIRQYLSEKRLSKRVDIFALQDIYGTALEDTSLQALVVTDHTHANGVLVAEKRKTKGLSKMDLVKVALLTSSDGKIISSERIRQGDIDCSGELYLDILKNRQTATLPTAMRATLKKPLGKIVPTTRDVQKMIQKEPFVMVFSVGDVITEALLRADVRPSLQIVDFRKQRKEIVAKDRVPLIEGHLTGKNPSGTISADVIGKIVHARDLFLKTKKKQQILVAGEEDLTALPAILAAPLSSIVVYGQPGEGVVVIRVDLAIKDHVKNLVSQFDIYA